MSEFLELLPPSSALEKLLTHLHHETGWEQIDTAQAVGRVTAVSVMAAHPLPSFTRSTVDGYAVRAADTFGANDSLPSYLELVGEVPMGDSAPFGLASGQCGLIHTGGMLPAGADAVVMVEHTQVTGSAQVEVLRAVAVSENVLKVGEDIHQDEIVIEAGSRLRPAEIGGLMALGQTRIQVMCQPRVGIISSGDEVIPPQLEIQPGQVRDINSYALGAAVQTWGGAVVLYGIVPDKVVALRNSVERALHECDMVVITAGSSASVRDLTATVINQLGSPGVLVHGVNVKPGKPTILAVCQGKAVIGLPGNPVSALVISRLFVLPVLNRLLRMTHSEFQSRIQAHLAVNLASAAGREDWVPVRLVRQGGHILAEPVFGKSNLIFTLAKASGLICIHPDATGLAAGAVVEVDLL